MSKKYIIGAIVLVIVVIVVWFNTTPAEAPSKVEINENMEILYTNDGFIAPEITVRAGTKVVFINKSDEQMWVASSLHPTHADYPEFDQLEIGDTYSFTFTEPGVYNYHNHLSPMRKGKIIVK